MIIKVDIFIINHLIVENECLPKAPYCNMGYCPGMFWDYIMYLYIYIIYIYIHIHIYIYIIYIYTYIYTQYIFNSINSIRI
jgi:hypothetical protein